MFTGKLPTRPAEIDEKALSTAVNNVLVSTKEYIKYEAIRHDDVVVLDNARLKPLKKGMRKLLLDPGRLDEISFLCSTPDGRRRTRALGAGRKKIMPDKLAFMVYARCVYMTWIHGKVTNNDILQAFMDYAPHFKEQLVVVEKGTPPPEDLGRRSVLILSSLTLARFRRRFHFNKIVGEGQTAVDPIKAMNSSFESQVRTLTARMMGVSMVANTDQSMIFLERGITDRGYACSRTGNASCQKKKSSSRNTFTICAEVCNGRFPSVYFVLEGHKKTGKLTSKGYVNGL